MNRTSVHVIMLGMILVLAACTPKLDGPELTPGRANFSKVVAMGGHIMAGYQDGALSNEGQATALPALLVRQIRELPESNPAFEQVGFREGVSLGVNSKPWESLLQTRSQLGTRMDCKNVSSLGPVKDTLSLIQALAGGLLNQAKADGTPIHNLSLPFLGLAQWADADLAQSGFQGRASLFYSRFPDQNQSLLQAAANIAPTFSILWPGMQDIYNWAANGGVGDLPDAGVYRVTLDSILGVLSANGGQGVLANLPDIAHMPFFTTIPARGLELDQNLADSLNDIYSLVGADVGFEGGANGFIVADPATPQGFRQLQADEFVTLTAPLDSMRCFLYGVLFQLMGDNYTLINSEVAALRARVAELNAITADLARQYDFALVDAASFYSRLDGGLVQDAVDFNSDFVSGGYFSLDGFTPHPKGTGLLTNAFIAAINAHYGATIPTVRLDVLSGVLFP